jgi:hypothetical protein
VAGASTILADFGSTFEFVGISELRDLAGDLLDFDAYDDAGRRPHRR